MARTQLYGTPVSPGICLGVLHFLRADAEPERRRLQPSEAEAEQARFDGALEAVRADLGRAADKVPADLGEYRDIISAQAEMTRDPKFADSVRRVVAEELVDAAWALDKVVKRLCEIIRRMDVP